MNMSVERCEYTDLRFIADVHLGKLAKYLRLLGFDTVLDPDADDATLIRRAVDENRILISRDRLLVESAVRVRAYRVMSQDSRGQISDLVKAFAITHVSAPFSRCLECNCLLEPVTKESVLDHMPAFVSQTLDTFFICRSCNKVYWKGSHYEHMKEFIEGMGIMTLRNPDSRS